MEREIWEYVYEQGFYEFLVYKILGIVESQVEMKRIFFLARLFTNLRKCHLQLDNLENLIFVNKNWLNDPSVGCKSSSSLVELIKIDVKLKEELKKFEGAFENDEVMKFFILD